MLTLEVTEKRCHSEAAAEESPPLLLQRFLASLEVTSPRETPHCVRGDEKENARSDRGGREPRLSSSLRGGRKPDEAISSLE